MGIDLYYSAESAPCRNVLFTAKLLGVELNIIPTDLEKDDHLKPEFVKLNPQHVIPTLNDNGFVLWESRAICQYLVNQYGKDDSLYPKEPKKRALVDARLYFDMGTLYAAFAEYYYPQLFFGSKDPLDPSKYNKMDDAFKLFDKFLEQNEYAAGDNVTIADLTLSATVATYEVMDYDISQYKNVSKWFAKIKAIPVYEEANGKPAQEFGQFKSRLLK